MENEQIKEEPIIAILILIVLIALVLKSGWDVPMQVPQPAPQPWCSGFAFEQSNDGKTWYPMKLKKTIYILEVSNDQKTWWDYNAPFTPDMKYKYARIRFNDSAHIVKPPQFTGKK